jgi:hypothetical protein
VKVTIVGFTGSAGSGKDTVAGALIQGRGFVKKSMAEPLYRIMKLEVAKQNGDKAAPFELFDLTRDLFGSPAGPSLGVLTSIVLHEYTKIADQTKLMEDMNLGRKPRRFLQFVGTEFFRAYDENVWADYFIKRIVAQVIKEREDHLVAVETGETILRQKGSDDVVGFSGNQIPFPHIRIVITDIRFDNEGEMMYRLVEALNQIAPDVTATKHLFKLEIPVKVSAERVAKRDDISFERAMMAMKHASEAGVDAQYIDHVVDASRPIEAVCESVCNILDGKKQEGTILDRIIPATGTSQSGVIDLSQFASKKGQS